MEEIYEINLRVLDFWYCISKHPRRTV